MKTDVATRLTRWTPRVLSILLVLFISLFALDVFAEKDWLVALLIHLIPSYVLILLAIIAWKNALIGSVLYGAIAIGTAVASGFEATVLYIPLLALAGMFMASGYLTKGRQPRT